MMAQIIDFQGRRVSSLLSEISNLTAAIEASNIEEAASMGLTIFKLDDGCFRIIDTATGKVRRRRICDLDRFMETERDHIANTLGFPSAPYLRIMAMAARGNEPSPAYAKAFRYFLTTIIGEAA